MKCDICDEEFGTENELMQHKAKMHAGESGSGMASEGQPKVDAREGLMPMPQDREEDELEEPDFPRAVNE